MIRRWATRIGTALAATALFAWAILNRKKVKDHESTNRTVERGRNRMQDGRNSGMSPDERVHRNDKRWR